MTDDTSDDDPTHRLTVSDDDERPTIRETFASLLGHDEPASAASAEIGSTAVRSDEWHIPFDDAVEVYLTYEDTEYRVVERDGALAVEVEETEL